LLAAYWAKANKSEAIWHPVTLHGLDVAATMKVMLEGTSHRLHRMANRADLAQDHFLALATFFAALHDLGKFSLHFQALRPDLSAKLLGEGIARRQDSLHARHDRLGLWLYRKKVLHVLLDGLKDDDTEKRRSRWRWLEAWGNVACGHHGTPVFPPRNASLVERSFSHCRLTSEPWEMGVEWTQQAQKLLCPNLPEILVQVDKQSIRGLATVSWELAGWLTLADWLGSDHKHFPYMPERQDFHRYWQDKALPQANCAVRDAGVLSCPVAENLSTQALFADFAQQLTPLQNAAASLPLANGPQLWFLEDTTGSGKTEASMILAARLFAAGLADRLFIGLPTMATANAMYGRVKTFWRRFFRSDGRPSIVLAHGQRHLVKEAQQLFGDLHGEEAADVRGKACCSAWLADSNRKSLWAHFGVGTIDQALLAALPVRQQPLRHAGLAGSLLVVDEVHACDPYMGQLLQGVLENHARAGGSAILLTATLADRQKQELAGAFTKGLAATPEGTLETKAYPALTCVGQDCRTVTPVDANARSRRKVDITFLHTEEDVYRLAGETVSAGRCFCWVRNTVRDVTDGAANLQAELDRDFEVQVFHSQFLMGGRLQREMEVLEQFGPESDASKRRGRVLVASQVVEQSLDLDFDILVSDLAPVDLLVQRMGRLRRHRRDIAGNPAPKRETDGRGPIKFYVLAPALDSKPDGDWYAKLFPRASKVYEDVGVLWKTVRVLQRETPLRFPEVARTLIEGVYGKEGEDPPAAIQKAGQEARNKSGRHESYGDSAVLHTSECYGKHDGGWGSEDSSWTPRTRLEEVPRERVYVATREGGKLVPLWQPEGISAGLAWELSSVRLRSKFISSLSCEVCTQRGQAEVGGERTASRDEKILVMQRVGNGWGIVGSTDSEGRCVLSVDEDGAVSMK
jgi:CRISPR-associated endonuclease/helicase Cas3